MGEEGVTIEFLSKDKLDKSFEEKLEFVLNKVKDDAVLVLGESWTPEEKRELIQASMEQVDEDFPGVEFMGLESTDSPFEKAKSMFYSKFMKEEYRKGMTIVGNARVMEKVQEERDSVSFLAKIGEEEEK